ncbi:hypothetical protein BUALT_Bualt13G0044700 [Buddleja alternifolia]|uniref:Uncharacterized protein n=1 Tax=Buddleja alternifolia TaxID=168488 RepID=A0AAV6WKF0_9LAMI|nr:hypothetical protein BUALT_Bualt13G0044700 [Buddleja alternifolia]
MEKNQESEWVMKEEEDEDDDIVCLDESFFINDNYELTRFTFGSQVLELYCLQSASTDFDLTGQLVWPGAVLLNDYLSKNADLLRGCSVIELGSGVGITGLLCSRFCSEVVLTDHNDEILTRNIELHESSQDHLSCAGLRAEKLEWGNSEQLDYILQGHPGGFDLVLERKRVELEPSLTKFRGSGLEPSLTKFRGSSSTSLFVRNRARSSIPLLFDTVEKLLCASRGVKCKFILGYVSRAKVMDALVINEARRHGLRVSEVAGTRTTVRNLEGVIYEITCPIVWLCHN